MSLPHVPDSVSRHTVMAICEHLELDPKLVESLEFSTYGLYVAFHATNSAGRRLSDGSGVARHRIYIPYTEEGAL
ncbi:hypothetical protein [Streptomyces cyanogenus]|uniref:Uncharacterized protein n=1 Tax=Streptomyces cyanogenus TaxID=80860 RepID=A0ABX7TK58_STRCY|nr:hypothetical protein [Streptomyces cyanogenus]QTD96967.1 hypothetical protein S1361_06360 [Streptomyces cyanogenus]